MAGEPRTAADPLALLAELAEQPHAFDFYAALRRLECGHPDRPRWGESLHAAEDAIRLGQEPSLRFAPATLAGLAPGKGGLPPRLAVLFFGLFGPQGPLPLHLTEYARDRARNSGDPTLARFADVFHHRMLALFYRAWASAQPAVQHDRPEADRFALVVGALCGTGTPALRRGGAVGTGLLHYAGFCAAPTRHAEGLGRMLAHFFRVPARVQGFAGHWIELPPGDQCRLGGSTLNAVLGCTTTVGSRVWDCQHKFRVTLGPVGFDDYVRLLPGGRSLGRLRTLVRTYVGDEVSWDVNVILKKEEIPPLRLGGAGRLGWTSWLHTRPAAADASELVLNPLERVA